MQRVPEKELMESESQALAYARADFNEPHTMFMQLLKQSFGDDLHGEVIDLGCGTADITVRFARAYPACRLDAVDGSKAMLHYGHELIAQFNLADQINLVHGYIPDAPLRHEYYDAVISNSLLHHLLDPMVMWNTIRLCAKPQAHVFVMDLLRPVNEQQVRKLVEENTVDEPDILKRDFYNSLLAAYTVDEVKDQLKQAGLGHLSINIVSDRHFAVSGRL